jgi:histidyl-tRNA synthetase
MSKPSLPQGTRDFSADTVRKRTFIFQTIKQVFELYGFQPLETPAMENLDTLMGKYGEEGDKLIFRILESGNPFSVNFLQAFQSAIKHKHDLYKNVTKGDSDNPYAKPFWTIDREELSILAKDLLENKDYKNVLPSLKKEISAKALRYDLTIPFARYVAMNHGQLTFPFKRYQMQPVWRADRPQKGRYREFYQCDADVVGSNSLLNEVELANIYATVFSKLGIPVTILINNRKILAALAEVCGGADKLTDITVAIDKLDKIGIEKVKEELVQRGLSETQIALIEKYLAIVGTDEEKIAQLKTIIGDNELGKKGIEELEYVLSFAALQTANYKLQTDFTLARGLNYYTGTIFEVKALNVQMGSIGGGGRYDDLTSLFDVPNIPGVGISFGVDRIYDVMEELKLFPATVQAGTSILFFNLGNEESKAAFGMMQQLRARGIAAEMFHEQAKFDKQFKYAEKKQIPFVAIIGTNELAEQKCVVKNLAKGEQNSYAFATFADSWKPE